MSHQFENVALIEFEKVDFSNRINVELTLNDGSLHTIEVLSAEDLQWLTISQQLFVATSY
jgi:hypothetical protein